MRVLRALPSLLLVGAAPSQHYVIDGQASEVSAKVAFFGLASKTARFSKVTGAVTLSSERPEQIDLIVRLDATAMSAPDAITLARLKGPKFFDVVRYPTIVFSGRRMRLTGDRQGEIMGEITARGVTRPANLTVRFDAPPRLADGRSPIRLDGETVIDRREFGMTAYPLIVGRTVKINIRAVLVPA